MDPRRDDTAHIVVPGPAAGHAAHAARPGHSPRLAAAVVGTVAVMAGIGIGTAALLRSSSTARSSLTSANTITVTPKVPLSDLELAALVGRGPDFGPLTDPKRRAGCLSALGYPGSTQVLGAEQLQIDGDSAVLLVLPGEHPDELVALAVAPTCNSLDAELIADTTMRRP